MAERWEKEAEQWLPEPNGGYPGSWVDDAGGLIAMLAGRLLVAMDELKRLRECRDGLGRIAQQLRREGLERAALQSRVDEALRFLGPEGPIDVEIRAAEAFEVLKDGSWYFVDGVQYCVRCRSRRCERREGGVVECTPIEREGEG